MNLCSIEYYILNNKLNPFWLNYSNLRQIKNSFYKINRIIVYDPLVLFSILTSAFIFAVFFVLKALEASSFTALKRCIFINVLKRIPRLRLQMNDKLSEYIIQIMRCVIKHLPLWNLNKNDKNSAF